MSAALVTEFRAAGDTVAGLTELFTGLHSEQGFSRVLATLESATGVDTELWEALAANPIDQRLAEGSADEITALMESFGGSLVPLPLLGHHAIALPLLTALGAHEVADRVRARSQTIAAAVAITEPWWDPARTGISGDSAGLSGTVDFVADATVAHQLLVPAGDRLYLVETSDPAVTVRGADTLDMTRRLATVELRGVPGVLLSEDAGPAIRATLSRIPAFVAAEQVGIAQRALTITVAHLNSRRQFGTLLGALPSLQHRLAEIWVRLTLARASARHALEHTGTGAADAEQLGCSALALCSRTAVLATEECVQLHGARGLRWDNPPGLLLKRSRSAAAYFGGTTTLRRRAGALAGIEPPQ